LLDIRLFREDRERIKNALKSRNHDTAIVDEIVSLDTKVRQLTNEVNQLRAQRNNLSKRVAQAKARGDEQEAARLMEEGKNIGERIDAIEKELDEVKQKLDRLMLYVPNLPHESVPIGPDETHNVEVRRWGEPRKFDFEAKAHWDLGPQLGLMDFDRAAKLSGSRFTVMYSAFARLERALINFMLDLHTKEHGYTEVWVPHLVKRSTMMSLDNFQSSRRKPTE
jgi:seryl-tRNA synthetase (EC 6.1.1.11)